MQHVLDDRLDRREAGAAGDEDDRLVGVLAQVERAERAFEAQDLAPLVRREQRIGEEPARRVPDVQLEQLVGVRRRREREAAPVAVLQQEVDVLAGEVLQPLVRRQLELDDRDVGRRLVDRLDAARQPLDLDVARAADLAHLDDEIGPAAARRRTARGPCAFRRRSASTAGARRSRRCPRGCVPCTCRTRRCGSRTGSSGRRASPPAAPSRRPRRRTRGRSALW